MNIYRLLIIITKEYLRKPSCLIIALLIPLMVFFINVNNNNDTAHRISIGYHCADDMPEISDVLNNYDGLYDFIEYNSLNKMQKDVLNSNLECAYEFTEDFMDNMLNGDKENTIKLYVSSSTTMDAMINESLFAQIFPLLSELKLENYITKKSAAKDYYDEKLFSKEDIRESYDKYFTNGSTFHINYNGMPEDYLLDSSSVLLSPLKGIIALMILLSALIGAYSYFGVNNSLIKSHFSIRLTYILVPTFISFLSSFLSIIFTNNKVTEKSIPEVFAILLIYSIACVLLCLILTLIIKNQILYISLIPMLILSSIVFTPFIIDFSIFIPMIKYISYVLPPYYLIIML